MEAQDGSQGQQAEHLHPQTIRRMIPSKAKPSLTDEDSPLKHRFHHGFRMGPDWTIDTPLEALTSRFQCLHQYLDQRINSIRGQHCEAEFIHAEHNKPRYYNFLIEGGLTPFPQHGCPVVRFAEQASGNQLQTSLLDLFIWLSVDH